MNKLSLSLLTLILSSCASYKVVPEGDIAQAKNNSETLVVTKMNEFPEGRHCFEPMMYVLTLGIIPTHCVDTYIVSSESVELGRVKVTYMQGWVALLIAPLPVWEYGYGSAVESEIKEMVRIAE